jgi:hypothetical protein
MVQSIKRYAPRISELAAQKLLKAQRKESQMHKRNLLLLTILVVAACASTPSGQTANLTSTAAETAKIACPAVSDVQKLLAHHAHAFGSKDNVALALPRSFTGETVAQGKKGALELALDRKGRFSHTTVVDGMQSASGVDAKGPWFLGYAGVPVRLRSDEAVEVAFAAWMLRRDYLDSFDPRRDSATCHVGAHGPQISVHYNLPAVGNPDLVFSLADAALLSVTHLDIHGHKTALSFREWSAADPNSVRWPMVTHRKEFSGSESLITLTRIVPGVLCPSRPSEDCLAPPRSKLAFSWPKETPVRVPVSFFMNEVFLHARVGDRSFLGLVDSGATVNVIDTGSPLASAFHPAAAMDSKTPDMQNQFPLGEIRGAFELGDLVVQHVPVAALPIPSFDEFGERRPEMLIGYPIFLGTAVRIDYARREFLLSKDARTLHSQSAIAIPLKFLGQNVVAEARIDGIAGWFVLDTGDSETLDLFSDWAEAHGFPGSRPTYIFRQLSEVGSSQTDEKRMRPAAFEFGPILLNEPLVAIDSVRSPSDSIAGQIGNRVFAHCAAIVFDIENRTLWLEPPCNRDVPEDLAGWILERKDSTAYPDHPWVVRFVISGGSADLASVKAGDRILQLGGKSAILDISTFESVTKQSPGTKVPAVIVRGDVRKEVTLRLVRLPSY